ncbi:hypothetical protein AAMO2058_000836200 [Amorphochlora amoebiformis]|mmetsp:Transcript_9045/g.14307  ORF Transcript_9045/g.14307 Transcript_9045/m.14307 type:complete len:797 (-) Transcript_9045:185-2575(-)
MKLELLIEDQHGPRGSLHVHAWNLIKDIKDAIQSQLHIPAIRQRLFFSNGELRNTRSICDYNISTGSKLFLAMTPVSPSKNAAITLYGNTPCSPRLKQVVAAVRTGLAHGLAPRLAMDGTGGTYFFRDNRREIRAVFKPADEEPFAPNNPRNYVGKIGQVGFRKGILSGEGYLREVAAYLLDRKTGFSGVPMTSTAEVTNDTFHFQGKGLGSSSNGLKKIGSVQEYVCYDDVAGDLAAKMFPASEVHKIAILDIRMANTDRNEANILVRRRGENGVRKNGKEDIHLIPIDHAYSLPDTLEIAWTDWVWLEWPQAKVPFDEKTRRFVKNLDIEADIKLLRTTLGIREACLRTMRITGMVLKKGVASGLTLRQIAGIICRNDLDIPSELEVICTQAYKMAQAAREQLKIKSPSFSPTESSMKISAVPEIGLARSISYNDFKPLKVQPKGFKISQISEKSISECQRRLDPSTHTWHLNDGKKKDCRVTRGKAVSQLFFDYLEKLMDRHVELCIKNSTPGTPCTRSYSDFNTVRESVDSADSAPWFALQSSPLQQSKTHIAGKSSLSFVKSAIVVLKSPKSMISEALNESGRVGEKRPNSKATELRAEKSWDEYNTSRSVIKFSPIGERPLSKSSDSDWSRSELESEDGMSRGSWGPEGKGGFNLTTRVSGFAPPLGNVKKSTTVPMSIPHRVSFDFAKKHLKPLQTLSRSAPRKVPAWKPSWKLRREKEAAIQKSKENARDGKTDSSKSLPDLSSDILPDHMTPLRVVGGFSPKPPLTAYGLPQPRYADAILVAEDLKF